MKEEIWKPIEGYKYYEVSSLGQVRSISHHTANPCRFREGRILSQTKVNNGYMHVTLTQEGKKKRNYLVHRLVAKAFVEKPDGKEYVNHKNGDKTDNRAENLLGTSRQSSTTLGETAAEGSAMTRCVQSGTTQGRAPLLPKNTAYT